ncbi:WD repeat-containing protein VIP3 [Hibiscus syriacus]|uniref:WD repeat-containing protein VIP3 n=1 Tax=Hibiscus syriacus TaxID=106335 RepID=A0A6A2Z6E4_HIBSY|nr:WD repeat-containing protein VIP3 [Hibiscus syriacus]
MAKSMKLAGLLLTGSLDHTVKLWSPDELDLVRTNTGHCLGVVSMAAHPSCVIDASAALDSFVRVFDVDTLQSPISKLLRPSASIKLWDTSTWRLVATLSIARPEGTKPSDKSSGKKFVLSVAWSPDGRRLACGSMNGTISIFDLYSVSDDGHVHIYDVEGKTIIGAMSGHSGWVLSVDVSPDEEVIATGSSNKTVRLWDFKMRATLHVMSNHTDQVWVVAFRPGGRGDRLASVSDDKSISLYHYS